MLPMRTFNLWRSSLIGLALFLILVHLFSVLELHQTSLLAPGPPKKQNKRFDHLVFGPAAGQGLPNRLQCQGMKALNKTQLPTSSDDASGAGNGIVFVTVFTIYNTSLDTQADVRSSNLVTVGNASYSKTERAMAVLNVFINFMQVKMPRSKVAILTDPASDLSIHRRSVEIYPIKGDYSRDKLMLQRIRSYIARP